MQVATGSFGYGYSPLNLLDCISFLVEACAKVNELFNLSQGGSVVHYIDARCVSTDDHDLSLMTFNDRPKRSDALPTSFTSS